MVTLRPSKAQTSRTTQHHPHNSSLVPPKPFEIQNSTKNSSNTHDNNTNHQGNHQTLEKPKKVHKKHLLHSAALVAPSLKTLYQTNPDKAVEELKKYLKETISEQLEADEAFELECDDEDINIFLKELLNISAEWSSKQDLLMLYTRWAKKVTTHFHSDSHAVVSCLRRREFEASADKTQFKNMHDILSTRNVHYFPPCKRRKGSCFGNVIRFSNRSKNPQHNLELLQEKMENSCKNQSDPEHEEFAPSKAMKGLAYQIESFQAGLTANFAKVQYRRDNKGCSHDTRLYKEGGQVRRVQAQNLMEYHLPSTFLNRVLNRLHHRCLVFWLFKIIFKGHPGSAIYEKTTHFTQSCRTRAEYLELLSGLCLLFPNTNSIDKKETEKFWNEPGLKQLVQAAKCAAKKQVHNEQHTHKKEISHTILRLNSNRSKYSLGLTPGKNLTSAEVNERKFLLLRAVTFQLWLKSNSEHMVSLREHVLSEISKLDGEGSGQPKSNPSRTTTTKLPLHPPALAQLPEKASKTQPKKRLSNWRPKRSSKGPSIFAPSNEEPSLLSISPFSRSSIPSPTTKSNVDLSKLSPQEWDGFEFRIPRQSELDSLCESFFVVRKPEGGVLVLKTSPKEFYSADTLDRLDHHRYTGPPNSFPTIQSSNWQWIHPTDEERYDDPNNLLYVRKDGDPLFQQYSQKILENDDEIDRLVALAEAISVLGQSDTNRNDPAAGPQQKRIDIQCLGQNFRDPEHINDQGFFKKLSEDERFKGRGIEDTVGDLCLFVWCMMADTEFERTGMKIAPDHLRNGFGKRMREHLGIGDEIFNAESATLVLGVLHPNHNGCKDHKDSRNDFRPGYTRTGVYNIILASQDNSIVLHLQIILNFRKAVGDMVRPISVAKGVKKCVDNIKEYAQLLDQDYKRKFSKGTSTFGPPPTTFNRHNLLLCDQLDYERESLVDSQLELDCLFPMVSPSRILSYSMFIEPLVKCRSLMKRDQLLELVFFGSLMNNPLRFYPILNKLVDNHKDKSNPFLFSEHPFYDLVDALTERFGGQWQSGRKHRFSPVGGKDDGLPKAFGFGEFKDLRQQLGVARLVSIIDILYKHCGWIDSFAGKLDLDPIKDMPLSDIHEHMDVVTQSIKKVQECQFGIFRLGVFTTLATGIGILKKGVHLRHLAVPAPNCASANHLKRNGIQPKEFDDAMSSIATGLGIEYFRDTIETLLCEASGRISLTTTIVDWFAKEGIVFDIDSTGCILKREYGLESKWEHLEIHNDQSTEYLGSHHGKKNSSNIVYFQEGSTMSDSVNDLMNDEMLESARYLPPTAFTKEPPGGCKLQDVFARDRIFYHREWDLPQKPYADVLDNGNVVVSQEDMGQLGTKFDHIFESFAERGFHYKMMVYRTSPPSNQIKIYQRHKDKYQFTEHGVAFIPLSTAFYSVLQVPPPEEGDDSRRFFIWVSNLEDKNDVKGIARFLKDFGVNSNKFLQWITKVGEDPSLSKSFHREFKAGISIYKCDTETTLAFHASNIAHGTIVPKSICPRHLCILSQLSCTTARGKEINRGLDPENKNRPAQKRQRTTRSSYRTLK